MYKYISNNETDTMNLAKQLASKLNNGDLIVLSGDLGSEKQNLPKVFYPTLDLKMKFLAQLLLLLMNIKKKI